MFAVDNTSKQGLAWARFQALRSNSPNWWDERDVSQFHEIVSALEGAYAVNLSSFRIPNAELKPRIVGVQRAPRSGRFPARRQMSDKRYCNEQFARRQMEGIALYFQSLQPPPERQKLGFQRGREVRKVADPLDMDPSRPVQGAAMIEPGPDCDLRTARRLEDIRLSTLLEEAAAQRERDLNAFVNRPPAQGLGDSGGRFQREMDIIFASTESLIEKAIACRKELAVKVPALLLAFPHLKEFHTKLDNWIDGAVITLRTRHLKCPAGLGDAVMGASVRRASALKARMNREIQALSLEATLGMHLGDEPQVTNLNISNSTIATLNLGTVFGDLNSSIETLSTSGQNELAAALRALAEAIGALSKLDHRKEMLENLAHVSEQARLPAEKRKTGPLKASIEALKTGVTTTTQLMALWQQVEHALKAMGISF
jgi:hypothetical protein